MAVNPQRLPKLPAPRIPIKLPTPHHFVQNSGDRLDKATNKVEALAAAARHGSMRAALLAGDVDRDSLSRYLADGNFAENLKEVEGALAARLTANLRRIAESGKEENQLRATEFLLPALDDRFDAGVRRQRAANQGSLASLLMQHALKDSEIEFADPLLDVQGGLMPDKLSYQASDGQGSEGQGLLGLAEGADSTCPLEPRIEPVSNDVGAPLSQIADSDEEPA